jgi:RNA recognition motif-containing protein
LRDSEDITLHTLTFRRSTIFIASSTMASKAAPATGARPNHTLYCSNLPDKLQKDDLKRALYMLFSVYGSILDIVAMKTSKMRGQAHILFRDVSSSTQAMRSLQGFEFFGKEMVCSLSALPCILTSLTITFRKSHMQQQSLTPSQNLTAPTSSPLHQKPLPRPSQTVYSSQSSLVLLVLRPRPVPLLRWPHLQRSTLPPVRLPRLLA